MLGYKFNFQFLRLLRSYVYRNRTYCTLIIVKRYGELTITGKNGAGQNIFIRLISYLPVGALNRQIGLNLIRIRGTRVKRFAFQTSLVDLDLQCGFRLRLHICFLCMRNG